MSRAHDLDFEEHAARARRHLGAGSVAAAVEDWRAAAESAARAGDDARWLLSRASALSLAIEVEAPPGVGTHLREIFTASRDELTRRIAGSALSRHYHSLGQVGKALFYARAVHQGISARGGRWRASHQLGVVCMAASRQAEALAHLRDALAGWHPEAAPLVMSTSVLAYAAALAGRADWQAYAALSEALLREPVTWPVYRPSVHLSLGFAYLDRGRPEEAQTHAAAALDAIDALPYTQAAEQRAGLYLAGEAAAQRGAREQAEDHFRTLVENHYPAAAHLRDWLVAVRTAGLVNWLA